MDYAYNLNVPFADNDPSDDQTPMLVNTNSIAGIIGEDHQGFGSDNGFGGLHRKSRYICGSFGDLPDGLNGLLATDYGNLVDNVPQKFFTNGTSGDQYQMTRAIPGSFATFATNNTYGSPSTGTARRGGWTFLPGGLLLQYGFFSTTDTNVLQDIKFPIAFTSAPFIVQVSSATGGVDQVLGATPSNYTTTQFTVGGYDSPFGVIWTAIGI